MRTYSLMTTLITEIAKFHSANLAEASARLELAHSDYPADRLIIKRTGATRGCQLRSLRQHWAWT